MSPTDARIRCAELGIPFPVAEQHYQRERESAESSHERSASLRSRAVAHYGGAVAFYAKYRRGEGDHSRIPAFDVWSASLATEYPDLLPADDPAAALWTFLSTPADRIPSAAVLWDRALSSAALESSAREVSSMDDLIPAAAAAALADVSEYWIRSLVKAGKVTGRQIGRFWFVSRTSILSFQRHPSRGRPRRGSSLPADCPF
jgi:hypothetical protein